MPERTGTWVLLDRWLTTSPRWARILFALLLLAGCALADYVSGSELSFSISYLAPIALASWYAGRAAGATMAVLAALVWMGIDLRSGHDYSHPLIPLWNALVRLGFFLLVSALLLQIRRLLTDLRSLAGTDGLTGLLNSRSFFERMERERERGRRYNHTFTIAYIDLDNFKKVNDTLGHQEGDRVLQEIAACLKRSLRSTDLIARLGGDEFAILLTETDEVESGEALRKLHGLLQKAIGENRWPIGCSIGAVTCENLEEIDLHAVVNQADELMYEVKRSGKNRLELRKAFPAGRGRPGETAS